MRRALLIFVRALFGVPSPSLGRIVRFSDIWREPNYERRSKR